MKSSEEIPRPSKEEYKTMLKCFEQKVSSGLFAERAVKFADLCRRHGFKKNDDFIMQLFSLYDGISLGIEETFLIEIYEPERVLALAKLLKTLVRTRSLTLSTDWGDSLNLNGKQSQYQEVVLKHLENYLHEILLMMSMGRYGNKKNRELNADGLVKMLPESELDAIIRNEEMRCEVFRVEKGRGKVPLTGMTAKKVDNVLKSIFPSMPDEDRLVLVWDMMQSRGLIKCSYPEDYYNSEKRKAVRNYLKSAQNALERRSFIEEGMISAPNSIASFPRMIEHEISTKSKLYKRIYTELMKFDF